jgi:hypothetical protein
MSWALRYVTQLHKARVALDAGEDTYAAMRSFIPPIHFRRTDTVEAALRSWTAPRLERAMEQLAEAALNVRRTAALADSLAQRALLSLAVSARRKERWSTAKLFWSAPRTAPSPTRGEGTTTNSKPRRQFVHCATIPLDRTCRGSSCSHSALPC